MQRLDPVLRQAVHTLRDIAVTRDNEPLNGQRLNIHPAHVCERQALFVAPGQATGFEKRYPQFQFSNLPPSLTHTRSGEATKGSVRYNRQNS